MPIYRGGTKVERGQLKIGTQDVKEVYLGATKIWPEEIVLNPALNPLFSAVSSTNDGYDVSVTNYDASFTWAVTSTAGSCFIRNGLVNVSGLAPSQSATITVTTSKAGHHNGSGSTSGTANAQLNPALNPTFGAYAGIVGGWRVPVANYDASFTWAVTTTAGVATINGGGLVEVTGLAHSQSSTITVTTSKANHHNGSGSTSGKANDYVPPPPPELNFDNPSNGGYGGGGTYISYTAMGSGVGNAADCSGTAVIGWDVRHYQGEGHHSGNMIAELVETKTVPCNFTDTGYGVRIEISGSPSTSLNTCHMEGSSPGGRALRKRIVKATVNNPNGTVSEFSSMTNWTTGSLADCK